MKGKNKLVPRLLGVNKESVLRVDEKTKQVLFLFLEMLMNIFKYSHSIQSVVCIMLITENIPKHP